MKRIFKFYTLILLTIISVFMISTVKFTKVDALSVGSIIDENSYYAQADTSSGQKLIESLTTIVTTNSVDIGYDSVWDAYEYTDIKTTKNGKKIIWDVYSNHEYTFRTDQAGNYSKEGDVYNREHSVPKSWFDDKRPMHNDLFHLYPTDGYVNGKRSNYAFGEVSSATYTSGNGSKLGSSNLIGGTVFEPIDEYKGDFARTYFYMATRYRTQVGNWTGDGKKVFKGEYPYLTDYAEDLFVRWHEQDPVSEKEINRNDQISRIQKNRNPYIDHPEWVAVIWGDAEIEEQKYTVTYSVPSGTSFSYKDSTQYSANSLVTKPSNDPTLAGHTFDGWYTTASYTTKWNFTTDKITKNLTLYAKFTENIVDKSFDEIFVTKKILSQLTYGAEQTGSSTTTTGTESVSFNGSGAIGETTPESFDLSPYMTFNKELFSFKYVKNGSAHAYINNSSIRLYNASGNGSAVEITAKDGVKIKSIALTYTSDSANQLSGNEISISSDGSKAVLQNKAASGQCRINGIKITYEAKVGSLVNTLIDGTVKLNYVLSLNEVEYQKFNECEDDLVFYINDQESTFKIIELDDEYRFVCSINISDYTTTYVPKIKLDDKEIKLNGYSAKTLAKYYLDNYSSNSIVSENISVLEEISK